MKKNVPAPVAAKAPAAVTQPTTSPVQEEQNKSSAAAKTPVIQKQSAASTPKTRPVIDPANYPKRKDERSPAAQSNLNMVPGVNQIIPIAQNHPNRIVTPFANPVVKSTTLEAGSATDCGEVCITDNVIYVATSKEYPVTMFITERGSEAVALSLTMVPKRIPPKEINLQLSQGDVTNIVANRNAERWETSQPFVEVIRNVFRETAQGRVPQGYVLSKTPRTADLPKCTQAGIKTKFASGQLYTGHNLSVFIGVAENKTKRALEFNEQSCGAWNVAAVTTWPYSVLLPGQKTEVFVAVRRNVGGRPATKRKSLLGGS
ncbi:type-F conjugative transfer system secretin TraK [Pseudovibrio sp. Ad37]|uniref:TraK domain-containing protein n=1 Tax=Pseudovibrio sp. Ad37 TaxID=989422 RepID=UPI000A02495E|nr:type-F conjugative transfer system secretin TraK [Pseudovibrio sp. Ad37]